MIFRKKKAASTAGTDETAKEFRNHSDFSIDRIIENVKTSQLYGCLIVDVAGADKTEPHLYYHTNEELRLLWAGAVEACYHHAQNERQQKPSQNQYHQRLRISDCGEAGGYRFPEHRDHYHYC